ncbi:MAG: DUF4097 family beta strand repeat-containing protein [Bacteroidota bacterium]
MKHLLIFLMGISLFAPHFLQAQRTFSIPVKPSKRVLRVEVTFYQGSLEIIGWNEAEVKIETKKGGWISASEEKRDRIVIKATGEKEALIKVYVPKACNLTVQSLKQGPIAIFNVVGEMNVDAFNGSVSLQNVSGNALVTAWNGPINATFAAVNQSPMSFTAFNGNISLGFPIDSNARVLLSYDQGDLSNEFSVASPQETKTAFDYENGKKEARQWQVITLGSGGPEWRIRSRKGNVKLHRW